MPKKYIKETPTKPHYSQAIVEKALHLMKKRKGRSSIPLANVARMLGLSSSSILYKWKKLDMSKRAREQRLMRCAANRKLPDEKESIISGWLLDRNLNGKSTATRDLASFIEQHLGVKVSKMWISRFNKRHQMSYRTTHPQKKLSSDISSFKEADQFLTRLHAMKKEPRRIACLDKTGIYCDVRHLKQIGPIGR